MKKYFVFLLLPAFALLQFCHYKQITDVQLGTVEPLKAAHRFYERNGFERIAVEDLPTYFPRMMTDTIFYQLHLNKLA